MTCLSIDDMRKELYTIGDYSRRETEAMSVHEVIAAWSALPAII